MADQADSPPPALQKKDWFTLRAEVYRQEVENYRKEVEAWRDSIPPFAPLSMFLPKPDLSADDLKALVNGPAVVIAMDPEPTGWVCPQCSRVHAPWVNVCFRCNEELP